MRLLLDTHALLWMLNDPFERLMVALALSEGCTLVSNDGQLDAYGVARLW